MKRMNGGRAVSVFAYSIADQLYIKSIKNIKQLHSVVGSIQLLLLLLRAQRVWETDDLALDTTEHRRTTFARAELKGTRWWWRMASLINYTRIHFVCTQMMWMNQHQTHDYGAETRQLIPLVRWHSDNIIQTPDWHLLLLTTADDDDCSLVMMMMWCHTPKFNFYYLFFGFLVLFRIAAFMSWEFPNEYKI